MKAVRLLAALVVLAGTCLVGRASYLHAKAELAAVLVRRAWAQTLDSGTPHAPWPWADTYPVARLRIPRLGYDEMVLEGATPRTLAFGPAHLLSGAALGEPGNVVVAGHRTSWFRSLEKIAAGDRIGVEWVGPQRKVERMTYSVQAVRVVDPQDTALLAPTSATALTLVTCYPFGASPRSPQRFIVRALPLELESVAHAD